MKYIKRTDIAGINTMINENADLLTFSLRLLYLSLKDNRISTKENVAIGTTILRLTGSITKTQKNAMRNI